MNHPQGAIGLIHRPPGARSDALSEGCGHRAERGASLEAYRRKVPTTEGLKAEPFRTVGSSPAGGGIAPRGAQLEGRDPGPRTAGGGETAERALEERESNV